MIAHLRREAPLPLTRACQLLGLARSDYYRQPGGSAPAEDLLAAIEAVVLAFPGYGYRRVTAQLQRDGWAVNHKRILRLLREAGLLCRPQRRWVQTTQSEPGGTTYPNLLPQQGWQALTAPDQAWVADLTYIRLPGEFCYLAALLDAYSRRVVGCRLSRSLDASVALAALELALTTLCPPAEWKLFS